MTLLNDSFIKIILFVLGVAGFWVAKKIHQHKKDDVPLVCPIGFDCNAVVHSDYSEFMHIPLEILGMIYYALLSVFYLFFIFTPDVLPYFLIDILLLASLGAFLFSLYLIFVQIFILKKGCSWCFTSAFISVLIFILHLYLYDIPALMQVFFH